MTIKKILIIDDEEAARLIIKQYLVDYPDLQVLGECQDGIEAVAAIDRLEPDLVFLDIQMPGLSGFQVLKGIVHVPQIIFTTAFDQYALKAFDSNAVDYLLKPYTKERFNQALSKVMVRGGNSPESLQSLTESVSMHNTDYYDRILFESGSKMVSVDVNDIIYLEAEKDYTRVFTNEKSFLSNFGIGLLEQKLNPNIFMRIHRSHIININFLKEVYKETSDSYLILKNDVLLRISKGYQANIRKIMY